MKVVDRCMPVRQFLGSFLRSFRASNKPLSIIETAIGQRRPGRSMIGPGHPKWFTVMSLHDLTCVR
jgi:hypothetical protein